MSEVRTFRYQVLIEWKGTVEVDVDPGDDDDDVADRALDMAIDDAIASPAAYELYDHSLEEVGRV